MTKTEKFRLAAKLKLHRVRKPYMVITECLRADIKIATGLAMLEKETGIPQRNIFGCDNGPGRGFCHEKVTARRVVALIQSQLSNGVGWTQLTYKPLVLEANDEGGAHRPVAQCRVGFRLLRSLFNQFGTISLMYEHYNGSGAAAQRYAQEAVSLRNKWLKITGGR